MQPGSDSTDAAAPDSQSLNGKAVGAGLGTDSRDKPLTFDSAMRRLAYLMAFGGSIVVLYGIAAGGCATENCGSTAVFVSVGLMIGLASALGAGLVGFIFGVPYARDASASVPEGTDTAEVGDKGTQRTSAYRANTSLEQISDWLTKILVGVGLVEFREARAVFGRIVNQLAPAFGGGADAKALVASVLVFFAVCGFLFGFLWARLYLRRWLSDADRDLIEKLSRFDADAQAQALVQRQLTRHDNEAGVAQEHLIAALKDASSFARMRVFDDAVTISKNSDDKDYNTIRNPGAESIFRALIAVDRQQRFHRNHAELAMTLDRRRPPDFDAAIELLTEAIRRRDRLKDRGWRYYEFRRARDRIRKLAQASVDTVLNDDLRVLIVKDLSAARNWAGVDRWQQWLREHENVKEWLEANQPDLLS